MIPSIATQRLILRTPTIDDLPGYLAYRNEATSLASQMMDMVDEERACSFLSAQSRLSDDAPGWRMFSVERLGYPGLIGEVGIFIAEADPQQGDMGWWLHSDHRRQGYAAEAAKALGSCFRSSWVIGVVARGGEIVAALVRGEAGKGLPDGGAQIWVGAGFRGPKQRFQQPPSHCNKTS